MNEEFKKKFEKARNIFIILVENAEPVLTEKAEKLFKDTKQKNLLIDGAFKLKLTSSDGYVLLWSRSYGSDCHRISDGSLDLTLINSSGEIVYDMSWGEIRCPKGLDCVSVLDEYMEIASRLQFTDVKIVGSNSVLRGMGTFCDRYLGITEESYQPEIVNYNLFSPYESSMTLKVNEYLINHHFSLKGKKTGETNCYWNGNTIDQTCLTDFCGWYNASQSVIINCDEGSFLQINTSKSGFEIAYVDRANNFQRRFNLAIGEYSDECSGRLKEFSINDNYNEILHVSYKKTEKSNAERTYEAVFGSERCLLTEKDAYYILEHPEIKEFILFAIEILKEKLPNLANRMFEHSDFSKILNLQLANYKKDYVPNDIANEIVEKAIQNGLSSDKILKLKR